MVLRVFAACNLFQYCDHLTYFLFWLLIGGLLNTPYLVGTTYDVLTRGGMVFQIPVHTGFHADTYSILLDPALSRQAAQPYSKLIMQIISRTLTLPVPI